MKTRSLIRAGLAALAIALVGVSIIGAGRARAAVLAVISQPSANRVTCAIGPIGQSVTATATGVITTVRFAPAASASTTLSVYAGAGNNAGALLHSQPVSWVAAGGAFQTVTLTAPVPVTAGQVYTIYADTATCVVQLYYNNLGGYAGGDVFEDYVWIIDTDLKFEVVIEDAPVDTCAAGQINCGAGDEYVHIIPARDSHGDPVLHFYCLNAAGNGALAEVLMQDDFDTAPAHPASNTRVVTITGPNCRAPISAWVLTTGEYQINIGPDRKGNTIVIRFTGLPPANITIQRLDADR